MNFFRDFTVPLLEMFIGNLLMLVTIIFYIAWWTASFRTNGDGQTAAEIFIAVALLSGMASVVIISFGINSLSQAGKGFSVFGIMLGAVAFYIIVLEVTKIVFLRPVTSELLLVTFWAALEFSAVAVLQGSGRFGAAKALTLAALILAATVIGIACYILYYRYDESSRLCIGLIPLIADAGVVAVFLAVMAF